VEEDCTDKGQHIVIPSLNIPRVLPHVHRNQHLSLSPPVSARILNPDKALLSFFMPLPYIILFLWVYVKFYDFLK
jgi:hypothetical protein